MLEVVKATGQELNTSMFNDFVTWLDNSEKTTRTYLVNFRQFIAYMRYMEINNPLRDDVINYRDWLSSEHEAIIFDVESVKGWRYRTDKKGNIILVTCKANTVTQYLRSVKQFFKWTDTNGLYPNIAENVHPPKKMNRAHQKDALTPQQVLRIENSIKERASAAVTASQLAEKDARGKTERATEQGKRLFAMYLLTVNAGLRTVEISRANVKDYQKKDGQAWLYIWGKGHSEADQKKPLAHEVAQAIDEYLEIRQDSPTGNSPLFVATGNRSGGKRLAATTISTMLKKAMVKAGYNSERLTAHSLRHTTGTTIQEMTGNLYTTQMYMRHANPATTEIYVHTDIEKAETEISKRLYDYYHGISIDSMEKLTQAAARLTPKQLESLANIAATMV